MSEEQVTKAILVWLQSSGWTILDYDFPGGGTGRLFHLEESSVFGKSQGVVIPDVVAVKNGCCLLMEDKQVDTLSDYAKIQGVSQSRKLLPLLMSAYPQENVRKVLFGIGFSGSARFSDLVSASGVNLVLSVDDDFSVHVLHKDFVE